MKTTDLISISFQGIRKRGSRFWFTTLGMAVAIGVILFLVSLGFGLQQLLLEQITTEDSLLTLDVISPESGFISLTPKLISEIESIEGVDQVLPQLITASQVELTGFTSQISLYGVDSEFFTLTGLTSVEGDVFTEENQREIVINKATAELFNRFSDEIIGEQINITLFIPIEEDTAMVNLLEIEESFKIVGIIEESGAPAQAYIPRAVLEKEWIDFKEYQLIKVKTTDGRALEEVREELLEKGLLVSALSEIIEEADRVFRVIQIVLGIFGIFALIVAAIGLINTMTITLLERTNEIGIMRATGAGSRDIKRLFLTESFLTGFLGGLLGILLGVIIAEGFNLLLNIFAGSLGGQPVSLFVYPVQFLIFILVLSTFVGLIGGLWPAKRASRLNPLEALRYK